MRLVPPLRATPAVLMIMLFALGCGLALSVDAGLTNAQAVDVELLRYPYLQQVTQTSTFVVWTTGEGGDSEVRYSASDSPPSSTPATSDFFAEPLIPGETSLSYYVHVAQLTGLQPGTRYAYTVVTGGVDLAAKDSLYFQTDRGPDDPTLSLLVLGDSGRGVRAQFLLRDVMTTRTFDLAIHSGDVVQPSGACCGGTYRGLEDYFFAVYKQLASRIAFFPTSGNHDYDMVDNQSYLDVFYLPENAVLEEHNERYYSFDYGPVHFVSVDSEILAGHFGGRPAADAMLDWLAQDLGATSQPWKIVYMHKPPFDSAGRAISHVYRDINPLLEQFEVDIFFDGHNHLYDRTFPIKDETVQLIGDGALPYVTTGGGGGGLMNCAPQWYTRICIKQYHFLNVAILSDCLLTVDAIGLDGELIDHFALDRCDPDSDTDGLTDSAEITIHGTDPLRPDTDLDGCTDAQELGPDDNVGGRRDPTNPWDYFNPTMDGENRVDDILAVIAHFGENDPPNSDPYDRTLLGPNPWDLGPPNGQVGIEDILNQAAQYGHDCR